MCITYQSSEAYEYVLQQVNKLKINVEKLETATKSLEKAKQLDPSMPSRIHFNEDGHKNN